ncbi:MAG: SHOCT domain-containing protein [Anaerolineaceae bacterium]|nr:SHOCT domain-containing protein [Anaerolineaceae bacterium]
MSARVMGFLGGFFILAAVAFLIGSFVFADSDWLKGILGSLICSSDETMTIERQSWSMVNGESGENIYYFCQNEAGDERNVTDNMVPILIVGFGGLLTLGILMVIGAASKQVKTTANQFIYGTSSVNLVDMKTKRGTLTPETEDLLKNVLGNFTTTSQGAGRSDLSDRLQQLKDAYDRNLISKEEYDSVRQSILDSMDD